MMARADAGFNAGPPRTIQVQGVGASVIAQWHPDGEIWGVRRSRLAKAVIQRDLRGVSAYVPRCAISVGARHISAGATARCRLEL